MKISVGKHYLWSMLTTKLRPSSLRAFLGGNVFKEIEVLGDVVPYWRLATGCSFFHFHHFPNMPSFRSYISSLQFSCPMLLAPCFFCFGTGIAIDS